METRLVCTPKRLPRDLWEKSAATAAAINPVNYPPVQRLMRVVPGFTPTKAALSVLTTKYWGTKGVKLTVGFLDSAAADLRKRILLHMNAWAKTANVTFVATSRDPQVRIARVPDDGYWSYLGTDILHIEPNEPTMNLDSFTMKTPESEYKRVVRHETGHTLGFPHEHMRKELVAKIDEAKAIAYFGQTQGWSADEVRAQVLTPLEQSSLLGTPSADARSIMCYQLPGEITKNGEPIVGGTDIDKWDRKFISLIYPRSKSKAKPGKKSKRKVKGKTRSAARRRTARKRR
jgi:Astacin (Peptidase family M12A).